MRASLADQSLAIALGANLPSPAGDPIATLVAVRPQLEALLAATVRAHHDADARGGGPGGALYAPPCWSPLFATAPVGGPPDQPIYCNAVLLLPQAPQPAAGDAAALALLQALHRLEQCFGRQRRERWGPRSLDLDLLWWGPLIHSGASDEALALPHPRWHQRGFVLAPLLAMEQRLGTPLWLPEVPAVGGLASVEALLAATSAVDAPPQRLPPRPGWPE